MANVEEANKLARLQEEIGTKIVQLVSNAKKDSASRKTPEYISIKEKQIQEYARQAEINHKQLEELDVPKHSYFTSNYIRQIESQVNEALKYLTGCKKISTPSGSAKPRDGRATELVDSSEQEFRLRKQRVKIDIFNHSIQQVLEELNDAKPKARYEWLLKKITSQWGPIQELNEGIMVFEEKFEDAYFKDNVIWEIEKSYEDAASRLGSKISENNITTTAGKPNISLPKIQLPHFKGGYENWATFHDLFRKVIHDNTSLSKIEKMQYLKTYVREEAAKLIQHLQITDGNYETAWNLLEKRYQNNRLIVAKLIDQILDLPKIYTESVKHIQQLQDVIHECLEAIKNVGVSTADWGPLIGRIISRKWDNETNKLYEQSLSSPTQIQTLTSLMEFFERRFQSLEATTSKPLTQKPSFNQNPQKYNFRNETKATTCVLCQQSHGLYKCPKFIKMNVNERIQTVKDNLICNNCLGHGIKEECNRQWRCRKCNLKHYTMLHREKSLKPVITKTAALTTTTTSEPEKPSQQVVNNLGRQNHTALLATAIIRTKTSTGNLEYLRVLIDSGSQAAFITERAAQLLALPRQKIEAEISGLGGKSPKLSKSQIQCEIIPRFPSDFTLTVEFLILPKLTQTLPDYRLESNIPDSWNNHMLADPTFDTTGPPIDAILGVEEVSHIIQQGMKKSKDGLLGQATKIGWILSCCVKRAQTKTASIVSMISRCEEDKQLTKFWDMEEISNPDVKPMSQDDIECENKFDRTVKRSMDGTYTVKIPFKQVPPILGNSRPKAMARFLQLEKSKLNKDGNKKLRSQYNAFMEEYLTLGHMKLVPAEENNEGKYYIPHQPVIRMSSTTTKLRVVFDASSKTSNGVCLNSTLCMLAQNYNKS